MAAVPGAQARRARGGSGGVRIHSGRLERYWDTEPRWRKRLADVALNLALTWEDEHVGMVSALAPNEDGFIELISLWVAPSARGRGVGDEAVRQVVAWARREYPAAGVMLAVKSDNERAVGLYRRHGFTDAGASPGNPGERLMRL
ncbi:MAG: GNAT family N-acetyltransferase [Pseudonocardia sp.]|nr:GNAT family N-acetyltransferase [Pseudonocardia sp.]